MQKGRRRLSFAARLIIIQNFLFIINAENQKVKKENDGRSFAFFARNIRKSNTYNQNLEGEKRRLWHCPRRTTDCPIAFLHNGRISKRAGNLYTTQVYARTADGRRAMQAKRSCARRSGGRACPVAFPGAFSSRQSGSRRGCAGKRQANEVFKKIRDGKCCMPDFPQTGIRMNFYKKSKAAENAIRLVFACRQ